MKAREPEPGWVFSSLCLYTHSPSLYYGSPSQDYGGVCCLGRPLKGTDDSHKPGSILAISLAVRKCVVGQKEWHCEALVWQAQRALGPAGSSSL